MPPIICDTLTSFKIYMSLFALALWSSALLAGRTFLNVVLRSGSDAVE